MQRPVQPLARTTFPRPGGRTVEVLRRVVLLVVVTWLGSVPAVAANLLTGWSVAGAEFGSIPGRAGHDFIYPGDAELDHLVAKGMNVVRLPFRWERVQPRLSGELADDEVSRVRATVAAAKQRRLAVVLDIHNYARFADGVIGSPALPVDALADLWRRLATAFRDDPNVLFGLMNEPHDLPTEIWLASANAAVAAIRATGARNFILVPGNAWTGAHSWSDGGAHANATVMAGIKDPCGNLAFEVHQYFDADYSGTKAMCSGREGAIKGLRSFTTWLREHDAKGFLGEFGSGPGEDCRLALREALSVLSDNADVWTGWTAWAAGAWWSAGYPLSLQPRNGRSTPQVEVLTSFAARRPAPDLATCRSPR